jgi:hypothetical protein
MFRRLECLVAERALPVAFGAAAEPAASRKRPASAAESADSYDI